MLTMMPERGGMRSLRNKVPAPGPLRTEQRRGATEEAPARQSDTFCQEREEKTESCTVKGARAEELKTVEESERAAVKDCALRCRVCAGPAADREDFIAVRCA